MKELLGGLNTKVLLATCLLTCATPAEADLTYNYEQQWLFDSDTELYWQFLAIPASTFEPSHGSLATSTEFFELLGHADVGAIQGAPGDYSSSLANLLSFLSTNSPALSSDLQPDLSVGALYSDPSSALPGSPGSGHNYFGLEYAQVDPTTSTWQFYWNTTIGSYGPAFPCPSFHSPAGCPDTQLGLVFSTSPPAAVPVPGAIWLMISGIGTVLAWRRTQRTSRAAGARYSAVAAA